MKNELVKKFLEEIEWMVNDDNLDYESVEDLQSAIRDLIYETFYDIKTGKLDLDKEV